MVASSPHHLRNGRIRELRRQGSSVSALARTFGLNRTRIYQLLEATGGDPFRPACGDLSLLPVPVLERLAADVAEEIESRRIDRILGLDDDTVTRARRPSLADVNDFHDATHAKVLR